MTEAIIILALFAAGGLFIGLGRSWHGLIPIAAIGLVLLAYLGMLAWSFVWAVRCWDCSVSSDETRAISLYYQAIFTGIGALAFSITVAIGALLSPIASSKGQSSQ